MLFDKDLELRSRIIQRKRRKCKMTYSLRWCLLAFTFWVFAACEQGPDGIGVLPETVPEVPVPPDPLVLPPLPPGAPFVQKMNGALSVTWNAAPDAEYYELYYQANHPGEEGAVLAGRYTEPARVTLLLPSGMNYYLWLKAGNAGGVSLRGGVRERMLPGVYLSSLGELSAWLEKRPQNTASNPYLAALTGVNLRSLGGGSDGMRALFEAFRGRYLCLDVDACSGATLGFGSISQSAVNRPDKDKLVSIVLPSRTTRVGYNNFESSSSLVYVQFPPGLSTIGGNAFSGCASLERVDLPETLRGIESHAFFNCSSLKTVILRAPEPPTLGAAAFERAHPDLRIHVPAASIAAYKERSLWSSLSERIQSIEE
jgi:hypothetical protein